MDTYKEVAGRLVLMRYFRYRVTVTAGVFTCWYGGTILKIGNRMEVVYRFKQAVAEMQGVEL
jgi:hypothetical protein